MAILFIIPLGTFGQGYPDDELRKFSIAINSGASFGDTNRDEYFLSSNFSINTKNTYSFGAGIQYALTPAWSVELGYQRTRIIGLDVPFETQMNMISFRNIINLNQILFINLVTERINPFVTAGVGYDLYNYRNPNEQIYNHNSSYNLGGGIACKLTNAIDLFTHYDFHIGSNEMDNETGGWGADLINSLTAGIRLNFGKPDAIHPSWGAYSADLNPSDYDLLMAQVERINRLGTQVEELEERSDRNDRKTAVALDESRAEIDSLKARMDRLEKRMDDLGFALATLQGEINPVVVDNETGIAELLPSGHYVQVFATNHLPIAQRVRNHAVESLNNTLSDAEHKIFIIKRKQYYEVLIGVLTKFKDASSIQKVMTSFHKDAYVISFPRPVNLNVDFEDLKVIE